MKEKYDENTGRMVIVVDDSGVHGGLSHAKPVTARSKDLVWQLYDAMGWPSGVRFSPDMKLEVTEIQYAIDFDKGGKGIVRVCYRFRDGTEGMLEDAVEEFPSETLRAALTMMTGPVDRLRLKHRNDVKDRAARLQRAAKRSNRPW